MDCFGTIAETQRALDRDKHVVIAFAPGEPTMRSSDFWFITGRSNEILLDVPETDLGKILTGITVLPDAS